MRQLSSECKTALKSKEWQWRDEQSLPLRKVYRTQFKAMHEAAYRGVNIAAVRDTTVPW